MKYPMIVALVLTLTACTAQEPPAPSPPASSSSGKAMIGLPNPASVYCGKQGGRLDLRHDGQGNVSGICTFPDGRECEEWSLFRDHQCVKPQDPSAMQH
ncbi:putative hemolysin [Dyella sp. 20L07]|uniref:putative hemolysin n=1 Tax=Dyella sp. 20L07 TaxID=3384240 RepID=UPI003D295918